MSDARLTHSAKIGGKPLRFYSVREKTFVEFEQFEACIGSSREVRRRHLRKLHSVCRDKIVLAHIGEVDTTLMPRWMAEAVVGHGRKYHWLAERIADELDAALAEAETIARQERLAAA
ncbi:MAG: hypothetical protein ACR65X_10275 [Methylocystis sp.]